MENRESFASEAKGCVLVTGSTRSGKTTLLQKHSLINGSQSSLYIDLCRVPQEKAVELLTAVHNDLNDKTRHYPPVVLIDEPNFQNFNGLEVAHMVSKIARLSEALGGKVILSTQRESDLPGFLRPEFNSHVNCDDVP